MILGIVEDDEDVRRSLERLLRGLGHDVRAFASAEDFADNDFAADCVIVDVRLPGASGVELRERLRQRVTPMPVVLITGDADTKLPDLARASNAPSISKPFDAATLMAAIARALTAQDIAASRRNGH